MEGIFQLFSEDHFGTTYRNVFEDVLNGESVAIYGMPGAGIQYFLRFLENKLKQKYSTRNVLFFRCSLMKKSTVEKVEKAVLKLSKNRRSLERIENVLAQFNKENKLFMIFDGLQHIEKPSEFLDFLDSLRKTNPNNVVNIISINYEIFKTLADIVKSHGATISSIHKLKLFDEQGVRRIIEVNNRFFGWEVPLTCVNKIHELGGGNARLTKYLSKAVDDNGIEILEDLDSLCSFPTLGYCLNTLTSTLFELDKDSLKKLDILTEDDELFSLLLKHSVQNYEMENLDELVPELSLKEKRLFSFLFINRGRIVPKEQLDFISGLIEEKYSMWASYRAISRLKNKIGKKFSLKAVKGQGYVMDSLDK